MAQFSVIIPAYKGAATIERAVRSALCQTVPCEVIVCDDGSPDDIAGALRDVRNDITLIHQANGGVNAARNRAISASSGEWVVLLDQDDEWLPPRLERMGECTKVPNVDLVTTDAWVRAPGQIDGSWYNRTFPEPGAQRLEILRKNFVFASAAIRRTALDRVGGLNEETGNEYDTWVRLILTGSTSAFVDEKLAIYYLSHQQNSRNILKVVSGERAAIEWAAKQALSDAERQIVEKRLRALDARLATAAAFRSLRRGERDARRHLLVAARCRVLPLPLRARLIVAAALPQIARGRIDPNFFD